MQPSHAGDSPTQHPSAIPKPAARGGRRHPHYLVSPPFPPRSQRIPVEFIPDFRLRQRRLLLPRLSPPPHNRCAIQTARHPLYPLLLYPPRPPAPTRSERMQPMLLLPVMLQLRQTRHFPMQPRDLRHYRRRRTRVCRRTNRPLLPKRLTRLNPHPRRPGRRPPGTRRGTPWRTGRSHLLRRRRCPAMPSPPRIRSPVQRRRLARRPRRLPAPRRPQRLSGPLAMRRASYPPPRRILL